MVEAKSIGDFSLLRDSWHRLHQISSDRSVFTTYDWQVAWWKTFGHGAKPILLAIYDNNTLIGLAPLADYNGCLSFIGGKAVSDYLGFISLPGHELPFATAVVNALRTYEWQTIALRGFRPASPYLTILPTVFQQAGWDCAVEVEDVAPRVEIRGDWETYLATLTKKHRHELRRKLRRLEATASWHWYSRTGTEVEAQDIDDFLHLMCWSNEEKACFMNETMELFFRDAIGNMLKKELARLYFLHVDGQRVASTICFDQDDELWLYNSGYDPAYAHLSAGLLLKALCIQDAIRLGKKTFDFLRGSEPYKYHLGGADVPVYVVKATRETRAQDSSCSFPDEQQ
jgi:CelD/BcsL family acetyltransferase involved in cellulose biosynthesis